MLAWFVVVYNIGGAYGYEVPTRERSGRPILLWHPMKTGGTAICVLSKSYEFESWHLEKFGFSFGLNCKMSGKEEKMYNDDPELKVHMKPTTRGYQGFKGPVDAEGIKLLRKTSGRGLIAFEPSYPIHSFGDPDLYGVLTNEDIWEGYFHAITIRHPVERAFSHLFFRKSFLKCTDEQSLDDFFLDMLGGNCGEICEQNTCDHIRFIIGRFYLKHLSPKPWNLRAAVENMMRRIDVVLPIGERPFETAHMAKHFFGWDGVEDVGVERIGSYDHETAHQESFPKMYDRLMKLETEDLELYDIAMEKSRRLCETVPGCEWNADDAETADRRKELWDKWVEELDLDENNTN
ncbi:hypothetical protein NDN08_003356 [Rhodosorus marinus]|uniref:Sulfotransferase domain-containing protein n=1 Tax=Rhodosorus marinus TaxID=101924 RepID=A0AAV8UZY2_9RHOD|nr:hypothetical protein NDN08_003356 [Rhodosorus marinus]